MQTQSSGQEISMSTFITNEFHAAPGRGDDVLALLLELSSESARRPGCQHISIRRNQDDPDGVMGITQWEARQNWDDYLAWRTVNGFTATFEEMLVQPMMIRYWDEIPYRH
jgi:quinol monooxygenase YgiN